MNLTKLNIKGLTLDEFMKEVESHDFLTPEISKDHVLKNGILPFHHRDPFDRLIIAQDLVEGWHLVTSDDVFDDYGVHRIW